MSGASQTGTRLEIAVPWLPAQDIAATAVFYRKLGFAVAYDDGETLQLRRDGAELFFWRCAERHLAENSSCYIRVTDPVALYGEWRAAEPPRLIAPEVKPWGMLEFYLIDPNGNLLRIGASASEAPQLPPVPVPPVPA